MLEVKQTVSVMRLKVTCCFLLCLTLIKSENSFEKCLNDGGQKLIDTVCVPKNHDKFSLPQIPLDINATIALKSIQSIDPHKYGITGLMWIWTTWKDPQLVANASKDSREFRPVLENVLDLVWIPDIFAYQLTEYQEMNTKSKYAIHIGNINGEVYVTKGMRYLLTVNCKMDFSNFPFDTQNCVFEFGLIQMNSNFVNIKSNLYNQMVTQASVEFDFETENHRGQQLLTLLGQNNTFETFGVKVTLIRNIHSYVWNYFIPVCGMSLTGSISFLIMPEAVPGRIALLITLQLVLIQIFQQVQVIVTSFSL